VNSPEFDPRPVEQEVARYLEACRRNNTTCELVLKDISTIANRPENLTQWADTVAEVIDRYY
jgi:predicted glycosyltransferase